MGKPRNFDLLFFYEQDEQITMVYENSTTIKTIDKQEFNELQKVCRINMKYFTGYENTKDDLIAFRSDFISWNEALKKPTFYKNGKKYWLDIKHYPSLQIAIFEIFRNFCPIKLKEIRSKKIGKEEFLILDKLTTSGLITFDKSYENKTVNTYGYDFSSEYPNFMCNLVFPRNAGKKVIMEKIDWNKIPYGIYRVKIVCSDKTFVKLFNFSPHHYTSRQLKDLYKLKDRFNIKFDLLQSDDEYDYNAYLYEENDFYIGEDLFGEWNNAMEEIKKVGGSNQLVKILRSSLWGNLCETNKIYINYQGENELEEYDCETDYYYKGLKNLQHVLIKYDDIAKHGGFYRMKYFLTTNVRMFMLSYALKNNIEEKLIRIHTDSFMLNSPHNFHLKMNKGIKPTNESKSTGKIKFYNVMRYMHICECGKEYKYSDRKDNMKRISNVYEFEYCPCGIEYKI